MIDNVTYVDESQPQQLQSTGRLYILLLTLKKSSVLITSNPTLQFIGFTTHKCENAKMNSSQGMRATDTDTDLWYFRYTNF